MGGGFARYSAI